ncbi:heme exporter protein CcmD [Solimonas aquatica]|uniref:Heme exporter protein D n=1 Tax=Solimonas aquatica TaxID=489703 RepID=A0A1H9HER6_9GAMM|nr:heme exporter protein CcmD [Solimonas aquatica]SEQ60815.1 heme exporter protein CcmD [Solimonas aquatica]
MSAEFWNMGGYALYVWGSFGAALAVHLWNVLSARAQRRRLLDSLADSEGEQPVDE